MPRRTGSGHKTPSWPKRGSGVLLRLPALSRQSDAHLPARQCALPPAAAPSLPPSPRPAPQNNKDYLDQSLDEIRLLQYINAADPGDEAHILRLYDYFYFKVGLFLLLLGAACLPARLVGHRPPACLPACLLAGCSPLFLLEHTWMGLAGFTSLSCLVACSATSRCLAFLPAGPLPARWLT